MKRYILAAALLMASSGVLLAAPQTPAQPIAACQSQAPYGFPQSSRPGVPLCHHAYATFVDLTAKIPEWVVYTLTPDHALGCLPRTNAFAADQSLPQGSSTPQDYAGTGYDKGHLMPDGDASFDNQAENESFFMTNMSPQAPAFNRGIWKLLETSVRGWSAQSGHTFTVYVGDIYGPGDKTIGKGVVVPHAMFKIVIDDNTKQVAGWIFPHVSPYPNLGNDLTKFRATVANIQQAAGITFGFPTGAVELAVGQEWRVDFGQLTAAKRSKCGPSASAD